MDDGVPMVRTVSSGSNWSRPVKISQDNELRLLGGIYCVSQIQTLMLFLNRQMTLFNIEFLSNIAPIKSHPCSFQVGPANEETFRVLHCCPSSIHLMVISI